MTNMRLLARRLVYASLTKLLSDDGQSVIVRTLSGPARGLRFRLNLMTRIEPAYWFGTYDKPILEQLAAIIQPGWTIWDCGIYLGYYTSFFAQCVRQSGQVIAFEPDPHNLERSRQNVRLNGFEHQVQFIQAAIGAPLGETDFIVSDNSNSHLPNMYVGATQEQYQQSVEHVGNKLKVRCISLDEAYLDMKLPKPNLIKLDIEGAEREALKHLSQIVAACQPLIVLELHNPECDQAAWDFSKAVHYRLQSMDTGRPITRREDVRGTLLCLPLHHDKDNVLFS
jgi:FkbM family methyltransferase